MRDPGFDALTEPPDPASKVAAAALDDLNTGHRDDVLVVGRVLGAVADATDAEAVGIDRSGVDVRVRRPTGHITVRIPFLREATDLASLRAQVLGLASWAAEVGSRPDGEVERLTREGPARTIVAEVIASEPVTSRTRRLTLGGEGLDQFVPAGPGQYVCLLIPPSGSGWLTVDESFGWDQYLRMPSPVRPHTAHYFIRSWRPFERELDVDIVLHGRGATAAWAERAEPGEPVALWGPRAAFCPPAGTSRYLLIGDETTLGGIAAMLEVLPPTAPTTVVIEVATDADRIDLPARPLVDVTWLVRDRTSGLAALVDAARSPAPAATYVWGGGEGCTMESLRAHLRANGFGDDQLSLSATWWSSAHGWTT